MGYNLKFNDISQEQAKVILDNFNSAENVFLNFRNKHKQFHNYTGSYLLFENEQLFFYYNSWIPEYERYYIFRCFREIGLLLKQESFESAHFDGDEMFSDLPTEFKPMSHSSWLARFFGLYSKKIVREVNMIVDTEVAMLKSRLSTID